METILKGENFGVLQLETTYQYMPTKNDINEVNKTLDNILLIAKNENSYFICPISLQWRDFIKYAAKENTILINKTEREILYIRSIRSVNKLTDKINGLYLSKKTGKKATCNKNVDAFKSYLCKIISYLTWKGLPINLINVEKIYENKKLERINLNLNTYKIDEDANSLSEYVFLTNTNLNYWKPNNKFSHNIINTGIIDVDNYKFYLPNKEQNYKIKNLSLCRVETQKQLNLISLKKLQKIKDDEEYNNSKVEYLKTMIEKNREQQKKF